MTTTPTATRNAKKVLAVVSNPAIATTTGWPVGFWASELFHALYEFTEAGYETEVVSPSGGKVELDALSDPRDPSGYSAHDVLSMGFVHTPKFTELLQNTRSLAAVRFADYDALFIAGGQGPMFTFRNEEKLREAILAFYQSGRVTAAVCHGTCALLDVKLPDGEFLIKGRFMTGFANSEEDYADHIVGQKLMPFRIQDEAVRRGANFVAAPAFSPYAVRDGNLITGQQQNSARAAARLIIEALGR